MRWSRFLAPLIAIPCFAAALAAQVTGQITGVVTDRVQGTPLNNATVTVLGSSATALTSTDGSFSLTVRPGRHQLRTTHLGFIPQLDTITVGAGQSARLNVALAHTTVILDQVVVVGYGSQRRSDVAGAVASVTPNVDQVPTTSLEQTLQGNVPGLAVTTASSAPGAGISIRIRGGSSVSGNNEPLYVIDGFPIENDATAQSPTSGGRDSAVTVPSNPLATLNPNDIQSIEILKDASATSIYGARGANGVILITTKRGGGNKPRFTLDSYSGIQSVAHRYDLLNGPEYASFANKWSAGNNTGVIFADTNAVANTDWQSQIFRNAPIRSLQIGVTGSAGAANSTRYALSGGTLQQEGVVVNSAFRRLSLRGAIDQDIGSRARLSSNVTVSRVNSSSVPTDGSFNAGAGAVGAALQYFPFLTVRRPDGTYTLIQGDSPSPLAPASVPNPVSMARDVSDKLADTRILANVFGEYHILTNLTARVSVGSDLSNRSRDTYYPRTTLRGSQTNGLAIRGSNSATSFLNENTLHYTTDFRDIHHLDAVIGASRQQYDLTGTQMQNTQFVSDIDGYEGISTGTQIGGPSIGSSHTRYTLASYFGRVNYSLLDRYLFTFTDRRDGSSRFGSEHQWGSFPSAAFGWRLSEEPFMKRFTRLDQVKLRVSYGTAGNPSIRPYQSSSHLSSEQYTFGGIVVPAYYPSSVGNPNLSWETTRQFDLGTDVGILDNRITFSADIYRKKTTDLLLAVNLPFETGFGSALQNIGAVQNNGWELGMSVDLIRAATPRSFGWTSSLTYSRNRNKVLDLGGVQQIFAGSVNSDLKLLGSLIRVGQPLGVFYGYQATGIFRDSAEAANYGFKPLSGQTWQAGGVRLADFDTTGASKGAITPEDRTIIGDPNPKFTGGFSNTFSYAGLRLSANLNGVYGNKILNLNLVRLEGGSPATNILADRYHDAWSATNPNGAFPKAGFTPGTIGSDITSDLLEDGSYLRLGSVTLDAAVPDRFLRGGLTSARLYITGSNLITWTHYSGFNPDVSSLGLGNVNRGIDIGSYPLAKSVTFGINLAY